MRRVLLTILMLITFVSLVRADVIDGLDSQTIYVITLLDGTRLRGKITVETDQRFVTVKAKGGTETRVWRAAIRSLETVGGRGVRVTPPTPQPPEQRPPPPVRDAEPVRSSRRSPPQETVRQTPRSSEDEDAAATTNRHGQLPSRPQYGARFAAGLGGGLGGFLAGGVLGLIISGGSSEVLLITAMSGYNLGTALAVSSVGPNSANTGTLQAALVGSLLGMLAGGIVSLIEPVLFVLGAPLGATIAYELSCEAVSDTVETRYDLRPTYEQRPSYER
jgi:hypothetical protein